MKRQSCRCCVLAVAAVLLQSHATADIELSSYTVDGGGYMGCTGGGFELSGTIGQPDAGQVAMLGGDFELTGGFWVGGVVAPDLPGDCDGDHDVDLADFEFVLGCLAGPGVPADPGCECAEFDDDDDVDLADFALFQLGFSGEPS